MNTKRNTESAITLVASTLFVVACSIMASVLAIGVAAIVFTAKLTFGIVLAMFAGSRRGGLGYGRRSFGQRTWVSGHYPQSW